MRLCGDYKVTLNKFLKVDKHPIPRIDDIFSQLQGGNEFSKLDLSQAYQQVELEEVSKLYTTICTHKGLFKYERLPYGISTAPSKFKKIMENILLGIKNVVVFFDDILVTGRNREEHIKILNEVLKRLDDVGLKVKRDKCSFFQNDIEYLGYKLSKRGLEMSQSKTKSILATPAPNDVKKLKSFIGTVNDYRRFIKNFSSILQPLYELTKINKNWKWSNECQNAFNKIKNEITSADVLMHYDSNLPLRLSVDASSYGLGAVLTHVS